jgi:arylsulfatase A-like enzyme
MSATNILFILTDDQGVWAAGCYGNPEIRTPNIDRLARSGVRFEHFFCATPVCSPSRATLLTGRIPSQHGIHDWLRQCCFGPEAIDFLGEETTYADVLAGSGWSCGFSGKWHVGDSNAPQHGFTDWFVAEGGRYSGCRTVSEGSLVEEPGYITEAITDRALAMLEGYAASGRPFYLGVHYTAPHSPWIDQHPREIVDSYDDCPFDSCPQEPRHPWAGRLTEGNLGNREALKGYFAAVTAMDIGVGRLLDRLEELGLRESTLVVFLSDNGMSCGHHGFWGKGNGTVPWNMYENSVRVPAIFSQPGRTPAGRVERALVSAYDFAPTLLDYLALPPLPEGRNLPGRSFRPALEGRPLEGREEVVVFDEYGPVRMIRTERWKYVHRHAYGPHELYDLASDPDERRNLAAEPGQAGRVGELKARMDEWFARHVDPRFDGRLSPGTSRGQTGPMRWYLG